MIESLGTPATLVITEPFAPLAASFSRTLGLAEAYHVAAVAHPVSTKDDAELGALAATIVDLVAAQLTIDPTDPTDPTNDSTRGAEQ